MQAHGYARKSAHINRLPWIELLTQHILATHEHATVRARKQQSIKQTQSKEQPIQYRVQLSKQTQVRKQPHTGTTKHNSALLKNVIIMRLQEF